MNGTQAVKELLERGFVLSQLQEYKEGNLSIGRLAEILEIAMVEALNLVARGNAHPRMPYGYLTDVRETAERL